MNQTKKKNCVVCLKVFEYRTNNRGRHTKTKNFRSKKAITCSPRCSKIYNRISQYINSKNCYKNKVKSKKGWGKSYGY